MKRVLVTGASGFIGRCALPALRERGFDVHAVSHRAEAGPRGPWTWHSADLLDPAAIGPLLERVQPTHLLHFAWYAVPGRYWTAPENFWWVEASLRLLQEFQRSGGSRVVMAGTCAEYDWAYGYCAEGITPEAPATPYGTCKLALNMMLDRYAATNDLSSAWGRIFFLYGPGEHPDRLMSSVIRSLLRGEPALCTDGRQRRDFLHVQDVAEAFVALLVSEARGTVNIGSGDPVRVCDVVHEIGRQLDAEHLLRLGARPLATTEPPLLVADTRRLTEEVGWRPVYDLTNGLADAVAWWRTQGDET